MALPTPPARTPLRVAMKSRKENLRSGATSRMAKPLTFSRSSSAMKTIVCILYLAGSSMRETILTSFSGLTAMKWLRRMASTWSIAWRLLGVWWSYILRMRNMALLAYYFTPLAGRCHAARGAGLH
jgi:hypothetical protein